MRTDFGEPPFDGYESKLNRGRMKKIYLACPYSHEDPAVCDQRFRSANQMAAHLMSKGNIVFSPLSHSHPISLCLGNSLDHDFWLAQDRAFVEWCDAIYVYRMQGWEESRGVQREIKWAKDLGKEVKYI